MSIPSLLTIFRSDETRKLLCGKIEYQITFLLEKYGVKKVPNAATATYAVTFDVKDIRLRQDEQPESFVSNIAEEAVRKIKEEGITSFEMVEVWASRETNPAFQGYHLYVELWGN